METQAYYTLQRIKTFIHSELYKTPSRATRCPWLKNITDDRFLFDMELLEASEAA